MPVQLTAGRAHCQHSCIIIHGLPYEYCTEGLTQTLLDCAGCPRETYVLRGEFLGDLGGDLAAGSHHVGSGKACLAYIQTPDDDRHLSRLPKRFFIDGDTRINISRPGQMRQASQTASFQVEQSAPQPARRTGPRPIRQRHRAAQARMRDTREPQMSQQSPSPQLQQLEARVQAGRAPGTDRSGLGLSAATRPTRIGPRFQPARDTQPAAPMDCTPPIGAQVVPATSQTQAAMEIDAQPDAARSPAAMPMEWETPACAAPQRSPRRRIAPARDAASPMDCDLPQTSMPARSAPTQGDTVQVPPSSAPPLELSGVPSERIEDCLEWLAAHTHFSTADRVAAIRQLHRDAPLALVSGGDSPAVRDQRYRLLCDMLRRTHGADSLPEDSYGTAALIPVIPAAAFGRQQSRPAIPPGFEPRAAATRAARQAAQTALAGLAAPRRSGRIRQQPTKWWLQQEKEQKQEQERQRRPQQEHRTPSSTRSEGLPARRPSQQ